MNCCDIPEHYINSYYFPFVIFRNLDAESYVSLVLDRIASPLGLLAFLSKNLDLDQEDNVDYVFLCFLIFIRKLSE